jgi:hypothetical protein
VILQFCLTGTCNDNTQKAQLYFQIGIVVMQLLSAVFMILAMITMTRKEVKAEAKRQEIIKQVKEEKRLRKAGLVVPKREIKPHLAQSMKIAIDKSKASKSIKLEAAPLVIFPSRPVTAAAVEEEPKPKPKVVYRAPLPTSTIKEEEEEPAPRLKPWVAPPLIRGEIPVYDPNIPADQWRREISTFMLRTRENDARDLVETESIRRDQFESDWKRLEVRERFKTALMSREKQISSRKGMPIRRIEDVLAEVKEVACDQKVLIRSFFGYACVMMASDPGSTESFRLREKGWMSLFDEISDPTPKRMSLTGERTSNIRIRVSNHWQGAGNKTFGLSHETLRTIFLATNDNKKKGTVDFVGIAFVRFEFYEALIRAALSWSDHALLTPAQALDSFVRQALLTHVPAEVYEDTNTFRVNRMYTQAVEASIHAHLDLIQATFDLYRDK